MGIQPYPLVCGCFAPKQLSSQHRDCISDKAYSIYCQTLYRKVCQPLFSVLLRNVYQSVKRGAF